MSYHAYLKFNHGGVSYNMVILDNLTNKPRTFDTEEEAEEFLANVWDNHGYVEEIAIEGAQDEN